MIFNRGEIVIAPSRITDIDIVRVRPCLVVSHAGMYGVTDHVMALMITRAANSSWPLNLAIDDCAAAGLRPGSVVRFKLFSIYVGAINGRVGHVTPATLDRVGGVLSAILT